MAAVEVDRLRRDYRQRAGLSGRRRPAVEAVRGISFGIEPGETYGLLGPNGAGKTTVIKVLTTLLLPTAGTARVLGHDVASRPAEVRRRIGYVFGGDRGLYDRLSAYDNLRYFAELYAVPAREQRRRIGYLLDLVDLADRQRDRVEGFSRGMRQRLHIARGLLHDPPVLLLDEPSIGLDPVAARTLRTTIADLAAAGRTILLTTHYMYEADELCDRISIIRGGSIVAEGTPAGLKAGVGAGSVLEVSGRGVPAGTVELIRGLPGVCSVTVEERAGGQVLLVRTEPATQLTARILGCLDDRQIGTVAVRAPTLEDAYVELVSDQGAA